MTETNRSKLKLIVTALIIGAIMLPISLLLMYGLGQTEGTEFSPDDFSRRSFSYNQTPWLDWVIIKKSYHDSTTALEENLVQDGLILPVIETTKNWHLISDSGSGVPLEPAECDARFLTEFLDLTNEDGDNFWTQWNEQFPLTAKVFWPRIADLARDEMYLEIPTIMQWAMDVESDDEPDFSTELDRRTARAYYQMGKLDFELQRYDRALIRLQRSVDIEPTPDAVEWLAKTQSTIKSREILVEAPE